MKKIILLVGFLAIVALAVFNLNLSFQDSKVNVELKTMLSVAKEENGNGGNGNCATVALVTRIDNCWFTVDYLCATGGSDSDCRVGFEHNNECPPYDQWHIWDYVTCNK